MKTNKTTKGKIKTKIKMKTENIQIKGDSKH